MFELSDSTIQKRVEAIESGLVQVTLKKCSYSLGFEEIPHDLSVSSLNSSYYDEGYSNKYANPEQERRDREEVEDRERTDLVFETGARKAVGTVRGTNSSKNIELLLGVNNNQKGVCMFKCPVGEPSISIRFDPNEELSGSENEEEDKEKDTEGPNDSGNSQKE